MGYGVDGIGTGNSAGVFGQNALNSTGPGVYAISTSGAPAVLAIDGLAYASAALLGVDSQASGWATQYPNNAGLFMGNVTVVGELQVGGNTQPGTSLTGKLTCDVGDFSGTLSVTGKLSGSSGKFSADITVDGQISGTTCEFKGGGQTGVHGSSGSDSGTTPGFSCGVWGESDNGYGVYGASKNRSGVYGTSGSGGLAGEFAGAVKVSDNLDVEKDVSIGGKLTVKGQIKADDVVLSGNDCAEEFYAAAGLEQGMVAVLDDDGVLSACTVAYDTRVAGVISGAGEFRPAIILDRRQSPRHRAPIALVGKVYCRVDASHGPIAIGDLLTSSTTPGYAMRACEPARAFGAIVGKALAAHAEGLGLIPMLVSLQ
jgi:hypothetical protein